MYGDTAEILDRWPPHSLQPPVPSGHLQTQRLTGERLHFRHRRKTRARNNFPATLKIQASATACEHVDADDPDWNRLRIARAASQSDATTDTGCGRAHRGPAPNGTTRC